MDEAAKKEWLDEYWRILSVDVRLSANRGMKYRDDGTVEILTVSERPYLGNTDFFRLSAEEAQKLFDYVRVQDDTMGGRGVGSARAEDAP